MTGATHAWHEYACSSVGLALCGCMYGALPEVRGRQGLKAGQSVQYVFSSYEDAFHHGLLLGC